MATTSNGDRRIDLSDAFVTVMQNARKAANPADGPSGHGPSAHVLGSKAGVLTAVGDMYGDPFGPRGPDSIPRTSATSTRCACVPVKRAR